MEQDQLITYIREEYAKGVTPEIISDKLTDSGWDKGQIIRAFYVVFGASIPASLFRLSKLDHLLQKTVDVYRAKWKLFVILSITQSAALLLISRLSGLVQFIPSPFLKLPVLLALVAFRFYIQSWIIASIIYTLVNSGTLAQIRDIFLQGQKRAAELLLIGFLMAVCIGAGLIALVVPGLILLTLLFAAPFVLVAENSTGISALKKSYRYVKGYWLPVAIRLVAFNLIISAFTIVLNYIARMQVLGILVTVVADIIFLPAVFIFSYALYRELSEMYTLKTS